MKRIRKIVEEIEERTEFMEHDMDDGCSVCLEGYVDDIIIYKDYNSIGMKVIRDFVKINVDLRGRTEEEFVECAVYVLDNGYDREFDEPVWLYKEIMEDCKRIRECDNFRCALRIGHEAEEKIRRQSADLKRFYRKRLKKAILETRCGNKSVGCCYVRRYMEK